MTIITNLSKEENRALLKSKLGKENSSGSCTLHFVDNSYKLYYVSSKSKMIFDIKIFDNSLDLTRELDFWAITYLLVFGFIFLLILCLLATNPTPGSCLVCLFFLGISVLFYRFMMRMVLNIIKNFLDIK